MRKHQIADEAQGFVLDAKYQQFEWAKRALEQARIELGGVIAGVGLSASARRIDRSRQWCLQVVQAAEEKAREEQEARKGKESPLPDVSDLIESVRRSGILEPLIVAVTDDDSLRVVDGHRRLRAAREAGVTSLPVMLSLTAPEAADELRGSAEEAARSHRRVRFRYARPDGVEALRTVDVWGVVRRAEHAYLIGFDQDRQAARTFRFSRVIGGITFVGEGTPPPEGFSAEASVWGPLDPESLEALEESFRRVLKEQRSSMEGAMQAPAAADTDERARLAAAATDVWARFRALSENMQSELSKVLAAIEAISVTLAAERQLAARSGMTEAHSSSVDDAWESIGRVLREGGQWQSQLHLIQDELANIENLRQRNIAARWRALDEAVE